MLPRINTSARFFDGKKHLLFFEDATPHQIAQRAIEKYREIAAKRPTWAWPRVCVAFAEQAAEVVSAPQRDAAEVLALCAEFRSGSKGIKGIFDLWALHDWLVDQADVTEVQ